MALGRSVLFVLKTLTTGWVGAKPTDPYIGIFRTALRASDAETERYSSAEITPRAISSYNGYKLNT